MSRPFLSNSTENYSSRVSKICTEDFIFVHVSDTSGRAGKFYIDACVLHLSVEILVGLLKGVFDAAFDKRFVGFLKKLVFQEVVLQVFW